MLFTNEKIDLFSLYLADPLTIFITPTVVYKYRYGTVISTFCTVLSVVKFVGGKKTCSRGFRCSKMTGVEDIKILIGSPLRKKK